MRRATVLIGLFLLASNVFALMSSENLRPTGNKIPHALKTYVDTNNCTDPIRSSPYIIIAGSGGANMQLTCPPDRPVMYSWKQQVGFIGFPSVSSGGGRSWITCCAVSHRWEKSNVG